MALPVSHSYSRVTAAVGAALLATLALGACSSIGDSSSTAAGPGLAVPASPEAGSAAPEAGADGQTQAQSGSAQSGSAQSGSGQSKAGAAGSSGSSGTAAKPGTSSSADLVAADKVVRNAALTVQVDDVEASAAESRRVAVAAGGSVLSENSTAVPRTNKGSVDPAGSRSTLNLAVPADQLDGVLDSLGKLGTVAARSSSASDVTRQYVDTQSRIATMKSGLDQVRALLTKTTDLNQIITLETEISRRQADLDSLQAQLNALDKKVAMSTVTLTLTTAAPVVVPEEQEAGFLGGLKSGWNGFLKTGGVVLTVVGAVLPFALLLALLAVPTLWWWRRRHSARPSKAATSGPGRSASGGKGNGGNRGRDGNGEGGNGGGGHGGPAGPHGSAGEPGPEPTEERQPEPAGAR